MKTGKILSYLIIGLSSVAMTSCFGGGGDSLKDIAKASLNYFVASDENCNYFIVNDKGEKVEDVMLEDRPTAFIDGLAVIESIDSLSSGYIYINEKGEQAVPGKYASCTNFSDGRAIVALPDSTLKLIDKKGATIKNLPELTYASCFIEGLSRVTVNEGKVGFMNTKGEMVIPAKYADATNMINGLAVVSDSTGNKGVIDKSGKLLINPTFQRIDLNFDNKVLIVKKNDKFGLINLKGEYLLNPVYTACNYAGGGNFAIRNDDNKWGLCNSNGEIMIKPKYASLSGSDFNEYLDYNNNLLVASSAGEKYGVINTKGETVVGQKYDNIEIYYDDIVVRKDNKFGLLDKKGDVLIEPEFDRIKGFFNKKTSFAMVNGQWVLIDKTGKILKEFDFKISNINGLHYIAENQWFDQEAAVNQIIKVIDEMVKEAINDNFGTILDKYDKSVQRAQEQLSRGRNLTLAFTEPLSRFVRYSLYTQVPYTVTGYYYTRKEVSKQSIVPGMMLLIELEKCANADQRAEAIAKQLADHYNLDSNGSNSWQAALGDNASDGALRVYTLRIDTQENEIGITYIYEYDDYGEEGYAGEEEENP